MVSVFAWCCLPATIEACDQSSSRSAVLLSIRIVSSSSSSNAAISSSEAISWMVGVLTSSRASSSCCASTKKGITAISTMVSIISFFTFAGGVFGSGVFWSSESLTTRIIPRVGVYATMVRLFLQLRFGCLVQMQVWEMSTQNQESMGWSTAFLHSERNCSLSGMSIFLSRVSPTRRFQSGWPISMLGSRAGN